MTARTKPRVLTRDASCATVEGRHRTVVGHEVAHIWAHGRQQYGINSSRGNFYFRGATIYSYGSHFPIARRVERTARYGNKRTFILFTTRTYSSTTAGHLAAVRSAIPDGWEVHKVQNPLADTETDHAENFLQISVEVGELLTQARKAKGRAARLFRDALARAAEGDAYAKAVGLRQRFDVDTPALRRELAAAEAVEVKHRATVQRMRDTADERARERRRKADAELAVKLDAWEQDVAAWKDGEGSSFPRCPSPWVDAGRAVHLRVKGSRLQTSMGAVVPLTAVLPLLPFVRGEAPEGSKLPESVGGYGAPTVDVESRTVKVGCHRVSFDEIGRVADGLGLTTEAATLPAPILADWLEDRGHD